jgi:pimeloyl-ACP methyl ester carboxylesterase
MSPPTDALVIMLHGATLNGHMWDPVRRELDPAYRVITPDLPGHGTRRGEPYTLAAAIQVVRDAAASAPPTTPLVLVGDSLGGYTAQAAARALPATQLKGLVLGGASANLMGVHLLPYYARMAMFRVLTALYGEPRLVNAMLPKQLRKMGVAEPDIQALMQGGIHIGAFAQAVRSLSRFDFRRNLADITQPTLFVNGDKDRGMVAQEASFLAVAQHPQSARFPGCEHGVSLWRVKEFAAAVNRFTAEVCAPAAAARV